MTEFLFFRHGLTDWNVNHIFQGHTDIPLNERGLQQAVSLAEKIQYWKPDVIVSSDLIRAFKTAEQSQKNWQVPIVLAQELREMNLGQAEGLHRDDVMKLVGQDLWLRWLGHNEKDKHFRFPNGESKVEARNRVLSYLEKFSKTHPHYKKIVVSTHGGILKRVTYGLKGVPEVGVPIPNCITYRLNFDGFDWHYVQVRERTSAIVIHENKILTFFAIDPFSKKEYHFLPGGMLEPNESIQDCAARETLEETGYEVEPQVLVRSSEYDFHWNNQDVWCRTHFVRATLKTDIALPKRVQDANYNKGVKWLPIVELESYFHYNESILETVKKLV